MFLTNIFLVYVATFSFSINHATKYQLFLHSRSELHMPTSPSSSCPSALQWLSLVSVIWLQSINGPNTDFPVYSSQLKHLLSISQVQLNNLAFASDAGKLFGFFSGLAVVYLPLWAVLVLGSTLGLVGYGVQYLFLTNKIPSLSYSHVFILTVLGGNAICWINTVCYITCINNFASNGRRVAVGLATSYVSLSAKIFTVLADSIFKPRPGTKAESYLLLNAVAPLLVTVVAAPLARQIDLKDESKDEQDGRLGFVFLFVIALGTGFWGTISSLDSMSNMLSSKYHMVILLTFLISPSLLPLGVKIGEVLAPKDGRVHVVSDDQVVRVSTVEDGKVLEVKKEEKEELGLTMMVRRLEFWLYFFGYLFGPTVGLVFLNNLGQIVESRGFTKTSNLVSLASSVGFFGRFMPPLLDFFFPRWEVSGPALITALLAPTAGAFFLLLNPTNLALYLSTTVISACTGAITSVAVTTTPELFGKKHFGVNHNVVVANIPIGSFLFGYFAAVVYQREGGGGTDQGCIGPRCYGQTFVVWGSLCSVGALLSLVLYQRTRIVVDRR